MTKGYNTLLSVSNNATNYGFHFLWDDGTTTTSQRYYDEEAETMDCFLTLYSFGVTDALTQAIKIYSALISAYYGSSSYGSYFGYQGSGGLFECAAGGFLQLCEKLWYNYPTLPNASYLITDIETRFLSQEWNSPQWTLVSYPLPQGIVIHARLNGGGVANAQYRLPETYMGWSAIYGVANSLTNAEYTNVTQMLLGTGSTARAIDELVFDTAKQQLSFNASGQEGTRGYVKVRMAKSLIADTKNIKVYLDGDQREYTIASTDDSWLMTFDYTHSTHKVIIGLGTATSFIETPEGKLAIFGTVAVAIAVLATVYFMKKRHTRTPETNAPES